MNPEDQAILNELISLVYKAMDCLTLRECQIVEFYYFRGLTQGETAREFDVSDERIRQIKEVIKQKMRKRLFRLGVRLEDIT